MLNTEQYQARLAIEGKPKKDAWGPLFDPRAVANLQKIVEATDARIVISSSWRYIHKLGSLRMMWEVRGLPCGIHDVIPHEATYISRGEDIDWYLEKHGRLNYVIIDDDSDMCDYQLFNFVQTDTCDGITERDAKLCVDILNGIKILNPIRMNYELRFRWILMCKYPEIENNIKELLENYDSKF